MLASPLPPLFLIHIVCQRRLWDVMVISFLVLWSICLSSSLVHLIKGPEYLTRGTAQVFISLIRFQQESFILSSFLVLLGYCLWFPLVWWCQPPRCLSICRFRLLLLLFHSFEVFHTNVSWCFFTEVCVTVSLLQSPGLFSVFWEILVMLSFGWSLLCVWFLSFPLPNHWGSFQVYQFQFVSTSPSFSIVLFCSLARSRYLSLFSLSFNFTLLSTGMAKSTIRKVFSFLFFFCWLSLGLDV